MRAPRPALPCVALALLLGACGGPADDAPLTPGARPLASAPAMRVAQASLAPAVHVAEPVLRSEHGAASYYADTFEGRRTASGAPFRQGEMVAAHRRFPFGTILRVTNLDNGRSARVRVVDRGPFAAPWRSHRRIIDLSKRAARQLGFLDAGFARVRVDVLRYGTGLKEV